MKDFKLEELKWLQAAASNMSDDGPEELKQRLDTAVEEREELENMNLDDCSSCRL